MSRRDTPKAFWIALAGAAAIGASALLAFTLWPEPPEEPAHDEGMTEAETEALLQEIGYLK